MLSFKQFNEAYNIHINDSEVKEVKEFLDFLATLPVNEKFPLAQDHITFKFKIKRRYEEYRDQIEDYFDKNPSLKKLIATEVFGDGSKNNSNTDILKEYGFNSPTVFIEYFQSIGFIMSSKMTKDNFVSILSDIKITGQGDFENPFGSKGKEFAEKILPTEILNEAMSLANGSFFFKKEIGITKPFVIWSHIKTYYSMLMDFEGTEFTKDNTSDIVVIDGSTDKELFNKLSNKDNKISVDKKTGLLEIDGVKFYQISLKKESGGARLGRITTIMKNMYIGDIGKSNIDIALGEGFLNNIKNISKKIYDNIGTKISKIAGMVKSFKQKFFKSLKSKQSAAEKKVYSELMAMTEGVLTEGKGMSFKEVVKLAGSDEKFRNRLMTKLKEKVDDVDGIKNDDIFKKIVKKQLKFNQKDVKYILTNLISLEILKSVIREHNTTESLGNMINDLVQNMYMGSTNLPIVKLYGSDKSAKFEILIRQKNKNKLSGDIIPMYLDVHANKGTSYYIINVYIIGDLADEIEDTKYNLVQFNNAGSGLSFKIEGNSVKTLTQVKKSLKI